MDCVVRIAFPVQQLLCHLLQFFGKVFLNFLDDELEPSMPVAKASNASTVLIIALALHLLPVSNL